MATKQIGKLKLHWSKRGVAYKWGDGEIHRLSFERKRAGEDAQGYDQAYGQAAGGQGAQDYGSDYGQNYGGQGYDNQNYDDQNDYYDEQQKPSRYDVIYQSDWLMYALLVVLPPLGIWILWKRERFTTLIRGVLTALSAAWFILLLVWLFSALFAPKGDDRTAGQGSVQYPAVTQMPVSTLLPSATGGLDLTTIAPAATPLTSQAGDVNVNPNAGNVGTTGTSGTPSSTAGSGTTYVYASATGDVYHKTDTCEGKRADETLSLIDVNLARQRDQKPCSICYAGTSEGTTTMYYANAKNKYYHNTQTCGTIKNLEPVTRDAAVKRGKKPCPVCIGNVWATDTGKYYHKTSSCSGMRGAKLMTQKAAVAAGKKPCPVCQKSSTSSSGSSATKTTRYYSTPKGKYYHTNKTCGGMKGATVVTQAIVKKRNQTACPVCVTSGSSSTGYYATKAGKYYHTKSDCSGMKNASKISLATAKKNGKTACPVCAKAAGTSTSTATYYATSAGQYYHKTATCSGMKGAKKVSKAAAEKNGKKPCPTCLKAQATTVYATSGGKYYHRNATCSGMKSASRLTLAAAKNRGKTACPVCYKSEASKNVYYYATKAGRYYHKNSTCSGMKNATKLTLNTALTSGKTACPVCLKSTNTYYFATKSGRYYHAKSNCSGMKNPSKVTLAAAQKAGKSPCPTCLKNGVKPTATPAPKVLCYASTGSRYYHRNRTCSGLKNLKKVALSVAKNRGKTACPVCVTKKVKASNLTTNYADNKTVAYASPSSAYYHQDKSCVSGLKKTTVAAAKRNGKTACPSCAKNLKTYVYVTRSGTKYHRKATCSGTVNAYKVSLTRATNLTSVRCTTSNAPKNN